LWVCESWRYIWETVCLSDEHTAWKRVDQEEFSALELRDTVEHVKWIIEDYCWNK
jgi:hypothetical protein